MIARVSCLDREGAPPDRSLWRSEDVTFVHDVGVLLAVVGTQLELAEDVAKRVGERFAEKVRRSRLAHLRVPLMEAFFEESLQFRVGTIESRRPRPPFLSDGGPLGR